jgi:hypothetical protein
MGGHDQETAGRALLLGGREIFETLDANTIEEFTTPPSPQDNQLGQAATEMHEDFACPEPPLSGFCIWHRHFELSPDTTCSRTANAIPCSTKSCA